MKEIGLFEAKTNLSKIAERVKRTGHSVTLTKRGEPYVDIVPHRTASARRPLSEVLADMKELRKRLPKSTAAEIKADIEWGRH
jgi:prevent-host-death family protein